jgi:hypothetical protein
MSDVKFSLRIDPFFGLDPVCHALDESLPRRRNQQRQLSIQGERGGDKRKEKS